MTVILQGYLAAIIEANLKTNWAPVPVPFYCLCRRDRRSRRQEQ